MQSGSEMRPVHNSVDTVNAAAAAIVTAESRTQPPAEPKINHEVGPLNRIKDILAAGDPWACSIELNMLASVLSQLHPQSINCILICIHSRHRQLNTAKLLVLDVYAYSLCT